MSSPVLQFSCVQMQGQSDFNMNSRGKQMCLKIFHAKKCYIEY